MREKRTRLDKLALWITSHVGTMGFFLAIFAWTVFWLSWNLLAPDQLKFDPPMGFVFWLFLSNLIQILLMPLIMVGQNIIGRHAEARAARINIKDEQEIEVILHHLEHQSGILISMLRNWADAGNAGEREGLSRSLGWHASRSFGQWRQRASRARSRRPYLKSVMR